MNIGVSFSEKMEKALLKAEQQSILFSSSTPSRKNIMRLSQPWPKSSVRVAFHRNDTIEYVLSTIDKFLGFADLEIDPVLGNYDDSLSFSGVESGVDADVHVVWLDFDRYKNLPPEELLTWLESRIRELRKITDAPILLANAALYGRDSATREDAINKGLDRLAESIAGLRIYPAKEIQEFLGRGYWDRRLKNLGGTALSNHANMEHARTLGLSWLPAAVRPRLKALVLDLDNTLYHGVLGEDGEAGVKLTSWHQEIQQQLVDLQKSGVVLAVASRNEPKDVESLFAIRTDFPLRMEHLSALRVGWYPKSEMIDEIADELNIGTDSLLFIDDNLGELAEAAGAVQDLHVAHAASPEGVSSLLLLYPNLLAWSTSETDQHRAQDLAVQSTRHSLRETAVDSVSYLNALEVVLTFSLRPADQLGRLHEIVNKTNQFILSFERFSEAEVEKYLSSPEYAVAAFALRDRLADSGNVGAIFAHRENQQLVIDELCISCRALGRGIETEMIATAVSGLLEEFPSENVFWRYRSGPRNKPGLSWLESLCGQELSGESGTVAVPAETILTMAISEADIKKIWD